MIDEVAGEREKLEQVIKAQETLRPVLGDAAVDSVIALLREKLASLEIPAEQRKQVVILFGDVSGFTAMSETMDAEEVREVMNGVWKRLDAAIVGRGGRIDKHIGDAVMALFGVPAAGEDDAERAVRAALAMQSELRALASGSGAAAGLSMRIGINSGPVVLGAVGSNAEFTVMGDAVNLASRLEHAAPVGGVLISRDIYRQVEGLFEVEALAPISVKGKKDPVEVYVVLKAKPRDQRGRRGVEGIETKMVGREAELGRAQDALKSVLSNGEARLLTITGEPGVGKSRLLFEFQAWIKDFPEQVAFLKGRASAQTAAAPYSLLRDVFAARFDILDSDSAAVARDKLELGTREFLAQDPAAAEKSQLFGQLLGFDFSASPAVRKTGGDAVLLRERGLSALTDILAAGCLRVPTVLLLEDVHWADELSLDAALRAAKACAHSRLLIVCATRPALFERRPSWGGESFHLRLDLKSLSQIDTRRLVEHILRKVPRLPHDLLDQIVGNAEGNPFYVEQIVKMLLDQKMIRPEGDVWRVESASLAQLKVPPTLTGVLQARLDGLSPAQRETLQKASIVGRTFWDHAVEACAEEPSAVFSVKDPLEGLRGLDMVFRREPSAFLGSDEYIFKHALLRDVAFESVLLRDRRAYHSRVAEWLVSQGGDRVGERAAMIAEHYEQADESAKAAAHWEAAGAQALKISAFREARGFLERALASGAPDDPGRARLLRRLGQALIELSDFSESSLRLEESLDLSRRSGDRKGAGESLYKLALVVLKQGRYDDGAVRALESLAIARELGDEAGIAAALFLLGDVAESKGALENASKLTQESLVLRRKQGDLPGIAECLNLLAIVAVEQSRFEKAIAYFRDAEAIFRELGDRNGIGRVLNNISGPYMALCRFEQARVCAREAYDICKILGNRYVMLNSLDFMGEAARMEGDAAAAREAFHEALKIAVEIGSPTGGLAALASLAAIKAAQGDLRGALATLGAVLNHPSLSVEGKRRAELVLAALKEKLPPEEFNAALLRDQGLSFEEAARRELS